MCCEFLSYIAGGGESDWQFLQNILKDFSLEPGDVIDYRELPDINKFIYRAYQIHAEEIKDEIEEFLDGVDHEALEVYKSALEDYWPYIYVNYSDSGYNEYYPFWNARNLQEILEDEVSFKYFVEFLVDEGVVEINEDKLPEELKDKDEYQIVAELLKNQ